MPSWKKLVTSGSSPAFNHITSSGNITATSGTGSFAHIQLPAEGRIQFDDTPGSNDQFIFGKDNNITIDGDEYVNIYTDKFAKFYGGYVHLKSYLTTESHITASGNISSSGTLTAATLVGAHSNADSAVQPADTFYIGTTSIAHNRGSAGLTLAGITLTTPNIGTPSAGTLTNCSGLPAANISQGTMASGMVLVAPALGTPASGVATNLTGTAASLTAGIATVANTVKITDNEATDETNAIIFTSGGDVDGGNIGLESDGNLSYNPAESLLTVGFLAANVGRKLELPSNTPADHRGADIVYFGAGETTAGTIYYLDEAGGEATWAQTNANAEDTAKGMLAVALGTSSADGMLLKGMVTLDHNPAASGAIGAVLYLSSEIAGDTTITAPSSDTDNIRIIGYCLDTSDGIIYFDPDKTFVEVTAG